MRTSIIFDPVKYQGYKSICFYLKDIGEIFCSIFCSFYLKLVLKNPPGYRPRQVCDFAQGDIRSWVQRGSWSPREVGIENMVTVRKNKKKRKKERDRGEGSGERERERERYQNDCPTLDPVINRWATSFQEWYLMFIICQWIFGDKTISSATIKCFLYVKNARIRDVILCIILSLSIGSERSL